jgi:hypothetical protein
MEQNQYKGVFMEYLIKKEFNNGLFDCLEIYHPTNKILEITNNTLWNATEDNAICIAKSRANDYIVSNELLEIEILEEIVDNNNE